MQTANDPQQGRRGQVALPRVLRSRRCSQQPLHASGSSWAGRSLDTSVVLGASLVNYADDFVICCRLCNADLRRDGRDAEPDVEAEADGEREKKTRLCRLPEETFDFLGYTIGRCYSPEDGRGLSGAFRNRRGKRSVASATRSRSAPGDTRHVLSVEKMVAHLNRSMLVGWANYFCLGPVSPAYRAIDQHVRRRLRQWLCAKHKVPGPGEARFPDKYLYQTLRLAKLAECLH